MTKKNLGKSMWNATKTTASIAVGVGAVVVTESICAAYAPAEAASTVAKVAYKVGTKGVSMVTGAVATDLANQEINVLEERAKLSLSIIKKSEKKDETKEVTE